ncbi:hypothetical protein CVT26_008627 [Gymnopilus dilepis]|uniref:F-box domain-containing protein n=1 Tax=Gymnopilus dilepis TaxID=231916 RepID=A0A409XXV4_9AGAR|nr:hypothetical protein CVT26_008627 [Gymnopilus dilepis]
MDITFQYDSAESDGFLESLPIELISTIFVHYVHSIPTTSPLTLGKICRRWRYIAWSTPELWTELTMDSLHSTSETHIELAEEWLGRSGSLPLSIKYSSYQKGTGDIDEEPIEADSEMLAYSQRMLKVLSRCSDRWHTLSLVLPSNVIEEIGTLTRPPSMLHSLSLEARRVDVDEFRLHARYPSITVTFLKCSPKIVDISFLKVSLDWTTVTVLNIKIVNIAEVACIFQDAQNLSECTLEAVHAYGTRITTIRESNVVVCPHLTSLVIFFASVTSQELFCSAISLPALKYLTFVGMEDNDTELSMDGLISFLSRSSCALVNLEIDEADFHSGSLIDLAPLLSSLTELYIWSSDDRISYEKDAFYELLADPTRVPTHVLPSTPYTAYPMLPCLEIYDWHGCKPYPWLTVPGLLNPVSPNGFQHRRPLQLVKIHCTDMPGRMLYIPQVVVRLSEECDDVEFDLSVVSDWDSP